MKTLRLKPLFVGESRSKLARKMGVRWEDGRLAAKQLFDALNHMRIDPRSCLFVNLFEPGGRNRVRFHRGPVVALGNRVHRALLKMKLDHIHLVHPAARGLIRRKENYLAHVALKLNHIKQNQQ